MKAHIIASCIFLALATSACSSNLSRTHRGDLLDDKVTARRVQEALGRAGRDFEHVQADATNGVVILNGTVNSPELRTRAEQVARNVQGTSRLEDHVQVHP